MVELATLVRTSSDRQALPPSSLAIQTLDAAVQGVEALGGLSLADLASYAETQPPSSASSASLLPSAALQPLLLNILQPFLSRSLSPETLAFLLPRLIITPTLIPLSQRGGPTFGADGVTQDSYLVCLKAVIPSVIALPDGAGGEKVPWIPFPLYKAQADCVAKATGQYRSTTAPGTTATTAGSRPGTGNSALSSSAAAAAEDVFPPSISHQAGHRTSLHSQEDTDLDHPHVPSSSSSSSPSPTAGADPHRPAGLAAFDPDYVVALVKTTIQPNRAWNWELPTKELRKSGGRVFQ